MKAIYSNHELIRFRDTKADLHEVFQDRLERTE